MVKKNTAALKANAKAKVKSGKKVFRKAVKAYYVDSLKATEKLVDGLITTASKKANVATFKGYKKEQKKIEKYLKKHKDVAKMNAKIAGKDKGGSSVLIFVLVGLALVGAGIGIYCWKFKKTE